MALAPYRPRQGVYARAAAAAGLVALALFASFRIFQMTRGGETFSFIGLPVPYSIGWAAAFFVVSGSIVALVTLGLRTGIEGIDSKTASFVELLSETETELQKVAWPSRDELTSSTAVVLVSMVVLGLFLFCVDQMVAWIMGTLRVLPV
jgi:preprotein translocase subunit SecE